MAWDDSLEGPGRDFAASQASRIRCLAGPGTGKTYALMKRVQRLIEEEGVTPSKILVVTLTRTAADDLRANLDELEIDGADEVATSTLHALCFSVLSHESVLAITGRTPRLLAGFERDILLKDLPDELGTFTEKKELLTQYEAAWSALDGSPIGSPPGSLPAAFQDSLIDSFTWHQCMLVGELVPIARTYLSENPYVSVFDQYDHVLVDEYQDLNRADHAVLDLLGEAAMRRGGQMAIIGDDDQCIYVELRHAHPRGIVDFDADDDIPLVECRRCPTRITAMAQSLIEHNPGRAKPELEPRESNPPGVIHNVIFPTMEDEVEGLAQFIKRRIDSEAVEPGEVLILANWRVIAYRIRDRLVEMGYEAHSYFKEEALDTDEARRALVLLTLLGDADDSVALRAYLALARATEERAGYRRIWSYAREHGLTCREVLVHLSHGELTLPYTSRAIASFAALEHELAELSPLANDVSKLVERVCPREQESTRSLRQAMERALSMDPEAAHDLERFAAGVRVQIGAPDVPLDAPFVRLMSLHKSKGLTVKLVVIAGLVDGLVPRSPKSHIVGAALDEHWREQRRILFVGITRPTEELVLSRFQSIDVQSSHYSGASTGSWVGTGVKSTVSSTLLQELGRELPRVIRTEDWDYT